MLRTKEFLESKDNKNKDISCAEFLKYYCTISQHTLCKYLGISDAVLSKIKTGSYTIGSKKYKVFKKYVYNICGLKLISSNSNLNKIEALEAKIRKQDYIIRELKNKNKKLEDIICSEIKAIRVVKNIKGAIKNNKFLIDLYKVEE